jgi:hypothetical protein
MHRPSRADVVAAASRRYIPFDRVSTIHFPDEGPEMGASPREDALDRALDGDRDAAAAILRESPAPLDLKYRADLARIGGDWPTAARLYLDSLDGDSGDLRVIGWLLEEQAASPEVIAYFSDPNRATRVRTLLASAVHDFPLRANFWRALGALHRLLGEEPDAARCAAKGDALAAAAARRRSALGRSLAASVYHFVGAPKGLIHEIWAQRRPAAEGRGGHLEEILGNLTAEMGQAVRNTFLSVREYALAKFPQQTADLFQFGYTYKVTKEDEPSGGLSAGLPTALAFLSVFLNRPLPQDAASSGVLIADAHDVQVVRAVGEPEYKVRGAYNRNLRLLLLPEDNRQELLRTNQVPRPIVDELVRFVADLDQAAGLVFGEDLWM